MLTKEIPNYYELYVNLKILIEIRVNKRENVRLN